VIAGETQADIARSYNVDATTIEGWRRRTCSFKGWDRCSYNVLGGSFRILIVFSNKNNDLALAYPRSRLHVNFRLPVVGVGGCPNQAFRFCDL
jgi:hypothetical protein